MTRKTLARRSLARKMKISKGLLFLVIFQSKILVLEFNLQN
jgi:hypothetical protein